MDVTRGPGGREGPGRGRHPAQARDRGQEQDLGHRQDARSARWATASRPAIPLFEILPDPTPLELTEARREVEIAQQHLRPGPEAPRAHRSPEEAGHPLQPGRRTRRTRTSRTRSIRLNLANEKLALLQKGRVRPSANVESIIRAPIAGTVLELLVNEGDPVVPLTSYQAGTALTTLADMSTLVFKGTVDEIDVGKLHEGMPARIKIGALPDAAVEGRVYKIAPKSKTAEGATLFDVEIELLPAAGRHPARRLLRQRRHRGPREEGRAPAPGAAGDASRTARPRSRSRAPGDASRSRRTSRSASPTGSTSRWPRA